MVAVMRMISSSAHRVNTCIHTSYRANLMQYKEHASKIGCASRSQEDGCEDTYETAVNDGDMATASRVPRKSEHVTPRRSRLAGNRNRNRKTMVSMPICGAEVALCAFCSLSFTFAVEGARARRAHAPSPTSVAEM